MQKVEKATNTQSLLIYTYVALWKQNKTKKQANLFNVMGATTFCCKASPTVVQYLLMLISKRFQYCLGWNGILF